MYCQANLSKGCAETAIVRNLSIRLIYSNWQIIVHERSNRKNLKKYALTPPNCEIVNLFIPSRVNCIGHWRAAVDGDPTMQSAPPTWTKGNGAEAREMPLDRAYSAAVDLGWVVCSHRALSLGRGLNRAPTADSPLDNAMASICQQSLLNSLLNLP